MVAKAAAKMVSAYFFIAEASSPRKMLRKPETGDGLPNGVVRGPRKVELINHPNCNLDNRCRQTFFDSIGVDVGNQLCDLVRL